MPAYPPVAVRTARSAFGAVTHGTPDPLRLPSLRIRVACACALVLAALLAMAAAHASAPLPSWRSSAVKDRILEFVGAVTTPGSRGYVTPSQRIAVFDDDGTLWPEKPRPAGMFALPELRRQASDHPEWVADMPFRGALELGVKYLTEAPDAETAELVAAAFAGSSQDTFRSKAREFWQSATHPRFDQPWRRVAYQPMRELIDLLRANGFRVFVVTAVDVDFARAGAEEIFNIPPDDVIGTAVDTAVGDDGGTPVIRRLATFATRVDAAGKPLAVDRATGYRPILVVGNVRDGADIGLLRYSQAPARGRPGLQLVIVHDDFEREYAYTEEGKATLDAAAKAGWTTVSMRYEWTQLFPFETAAGGP
jgi:phosphoglycolate phosphatase-like HAD superfamily hydrolase